MLCQTISEVGRYPETKYFRDLVTRGGNRLPIATSTCYPFPIASLKTATILIWFDNCELPSWLDGYDPPSPPPPIWIDWFFLFQILSPVMDWGKWFWRLLLLLQCWVQIIYVYCNTKKMRQGKRMKLLWQHQSWWQPSKLSETNPLQWVKLNV